MTVSEHVIELRSGRFLDLADPRPDSITLDDVAVGLSREPRYAGQSSRFYSVAEHALLVAGRVEDLHYDPQLTLAALHHDDAEAFVKDVPAPLKSMLSGYDEVEARVLAATLEAVGLRGLPVRDPRVMEADMWARAQEAHELLPSRGADWGLPDRWDGLDRALGSPSDGVCRHWLARHIILAWVRPNLSKSLRASSRVKAFADKRRGVPRSDEDKQKMREGWARKREIFD